MSHTTLLTKLYVAQFINYSFIRYPQAISRALNSGPFPKLKNVQVWHSHLGTVGPEFQQQLIIIFVKQKREQVHEVVCEVCGKCHKNLFELIASKCGNMTNMARLGVCPQFDKNYRQLKPRQLFVRHIAQFNEFAIKHDKTSMNMLLYTRKLIAHLLHTLETVTQQSSTQTVAEQ